MVMTLCVGLNKLPVSLSFRKIDSAWWLTEPSALQHGIHSIFFLPFLQHILSDKILKNFQQIQLEKTYGKFSKIANFGCRIL